MDIVGPFDASHIHGYRWILVMVDDHSRFKFFVLMKKKSEAKDTAGEFLSNFKYMQAARTDGRPNDFISNLKCDNAGEFPSTEFRKMLTVTRASIRRHALHTSTSSTASRSEPSAL